MSNENIAPLDLDSMSDAEVLALGPDQVSQLMQQETDDVQEPDDETTVEIVDEDDEVSTEEADEVTDTDDTEDKSDDDDEETTDESGDEDEPAGDEDPGEATTDGEDPKVDDKPSEDEPEDEAKPKEKPSPKEAAKEKAEPKADEGKVTDQVKSEFYDKITAPFKADGKDVQVRTPEDAIRLMQMGSNYSRRMQELKPLRAMNEMLEQHGLNDPAKLGFLIDIQAGKPEAIQKLLKEHKIDPLDIDVNTENGYVAPDYTPDEKVTNFKEAIKETLAKEGGKELIGEIASPEGLWDDESKEALKEKPEIFDNLLEQRDSGVYTQITKELTYQKTLGHLSNVPFLQAYKAVGDAMAKAGVFGSPTKEMSTSTTASTPIDTGPRKAATKKPNPNLSSTKQPRPIRPTTTEDVTDYNSMSDEDFKKLGAPM